MTSITAAGSKHHVIISFVLKNNKRAVFFCIKNLLFAYYTYTYSLFVTNTKHTLRQWSTGVGNAPRRELGQMKYNYCPQNIYVIVNSKLSRNISINSIDKIKKFA